MFAGDKVIVTKKLETMFTKYGVGKVGDIGEMLDVNEFDVVTVKFDKNEYVGVFSSNYFEEHFEKYEESKSESESVGSEYVDEIMDNSKFMIYKAFDKCTVVACQLPNGFIIVESSSCVNPKNYDETMGIGICMNSIKKKIFEMEAYKSHGDHHYKVCCDGEYGSYDEDDYDYWDENDYDYWDENDYSDDDTE